MPKHDFLEHMAGAAQQPAPGWAIGANDPGGLGQSLPHSYIHALWSLEQAAQKEPEVMTITPGELDAKLAAVEARGDAKLADAIGQSNTKFAEIMGELRVIGTHLSHIDEKSDKIRSNIWSAAGFIVASMIAIIALLATVVPWSIDYGADTDHRIRDEVTRQVHTAAPSNSPRISKLLELEVRGVIKPEHQQELERYRAQGLAPRKP